MVKGRGRIGQERMKGAGNISQCSDYSDPLLLTPESALTGLVTARAYSTVRVTVTVTVSVNVKLSCRCH